MQYTRPSLETEYDDYEASPYHIAYVSEDPRIYVKIEDITEGINLLMAKELLLSSSILIYDQITFDLIPTWDIINFFGTIMFCET